MNEEFREIYDEIDELLKENLRNNGITTSYIHGYLTAITCFPGSISNKVWFDFLFSSPINEDSVKWISKKIKEEVFEVLREAFYQVEDYLEDNEFIPLIDGEPELVTREQCSTWIGGFLYGLELWEKEGIDIGKYTNELIGIFFITYNKTLTERYKAETSQGYYSFLKMAENPRDLIIASIRLLYESTKNNINLKFPELKKVIKDVFHLDLDPEYIHGYLTSIECSPVKISRPEWIKHLRKDFEINDYESSDETNYDDKVLIYILNSINDDLRNDKSKAYRNLISDGERYFSSWCRGFVTGAELWAHYFEDSKEFLADFLILRYYADRDLLLLNLENKKFTNEFENRIKEFNPYETIKHSIFGIFYLSSKTTVSITRVNSEPKAGRNDPCPCGSGKKYKKCCGK